VHRPAKTKRPDGLTTREGLNLAGSGDPGWTGAGVDAEGPSLVQSQRGRDRALGHPSGLPGTTGRGPACPVVWEAGGAISPVTRLDLIVGSKGFRFVGGDAVRERDFVDGAASASALKPLNLCGQVVPSCVLPNNDFSELRMPYT
jgi:hypothetical protein